MITRGIINPDIIYDGKYRLDHLHSLINRWKQLLFRKGAKKGDLVAISILNVNVWHVSVLFACAELGLRVILLDSPAKKESLPYTKLARFGPARFCVDDGSGRSLYDGLHQEMIETYSETILTPQMAADWDDEDLDTPWDVYPHDPFIVSSTSGTTDFSRMVEFSHEDVLWMSRRNVDIFKFKSDSVVLHTKNMHHASSMLTDLMPSLMVCKEHYSYTLADRNDWHPLSAEDFNRLIIGRGIDRIIVPNVDVLEWLLSTDPVYPQTVLMNMSGFCLGPQFNIMCEKHNIEFLQHYGSIDTAIPLMTRLVTADSEPESNCLGTLPDTSYEVHLSAPSGYLFVYDPATYTYRKMGDILEYRNGKYYHMGRLEAKHLDIPTDLDLTPFYQDTKINMDQLRGFLMTKKYKENA